MDSKKQFFFLFEKGSNFIIEKKNANIIIMSFDYSISSFKMLNINISI